MFFSLNHCAEWKNWLIISYFNLRGLNECKLSKENSLTIGKMKAVPKFICNTVQNIQILCFRNKLFSSSVDFFMIIKNITAVQQD